VSGFALAPGGGRGAGLSVHEHVHAGEDEMFYVLAGELSVFCEDDRWTATPGSFVFVPRDHRHGFVIYE
jgi:quercetin dioxygenase-like cupin family protein